MGICSCDPDSLHTVSSSICVDFHPIIVSRLVPILVHARLSAAETPNVEYSHCTPIVAYTAHAPRSQSTGYWTQGATRDSGGRAAHSFRGGIDRWGNGDAVEFRVRLGARK